MEASRASEPMAAAAQPRAPPPPRGHAPFAQASPFTPQGAPYVSPRQASQYVGVPPATFPPRMLVSQAVRSPRAQISPFGNSARAPLSPRTVPQSSPRALVSPRAQVSPRAPVSPRADAPTTPRLRKGRRDQDGASDCKVHVSCYPPYTQPQDLLRVFSQFGAVGVDRFGARAAVLAFGAPDHAARATRANKKVNIYGEFLMVRRFDVGQHGEGGKPPKRVPVDMFPMSRQKGVIVEPKEIDLTGSFEQQAQRVLGRVRLTQEEAAALGQLYADLEQVLQPHWPGCVAMPFGSITTGLGIKTSDADCYVHIPDRFQNANVGANFVQRAKRVLSAYPRLFAEILSIPRANTPIVKFFHVPTETNCDLSFKTPLGAQNSKLISFLLRADPRLIPLAVLIKYWAKVHGISGTGKLTNYALTMMIIFYLQQPPISILPSVASLQRDRANDVIVDYWNTGFMDQKELPPTSNTSSISELLGAFFEYYAKFNFQEMVVCPYLGTTIKKKAFDDLKELPAEFAMYAHNVRNALVLPIRFGTPCCVQDPFEQSHNVASAINSKLASEIDAYFKFAAEAYEKEKLNNCEQFLSTILLTKPNIVTVKSNPEFKVNLFPKHINNIVDPNWKAIVKHIICTIFEKMMKLTLTAAGEKKTPSGKEKEKYTFTLTKPIWRRKQFNRLYSVMNLNFLEKQAKITDEVILVEKQVFDLQLQLTVVYAYDPNSASVTIKASNGQSDQFREFGRFFLTVMLNWFQVLVKTFNKPSAVDAAARLQESTLLNGQPEADADLDSDDDEMDNVPVESGKKAKSSDKGPDCSNNGPECSDKGPECNEKEPECSDKGSECSEKEPNCSETQPECSATEPECSDKGPEFSAKEPDCSDKGPESSETEPDYSDKGPECSEKKPDCSDNGPECSETEPDCSGKGPECSEKERVCSDKGPERSEKEPDCSDKGPECSETEPDCSDKGPECSEKERVCSDKGPERSEKEPDCSDKGPECSETEPDCSDKGPECSEKERVCSDKGPERSEKEPDCSDKGPECSETEPDCSDKGPECSEKERVCSDKGPERSEKEPDCSDKGPECSEKGSECSDNCTDKGPDGSDKGPNGSVKEPDCIDKLPDGSDKGPDASDECPGSSDKIPEPDYIDKGPDSSDTRPDGSAKGLEVDKARTDAHVGNVNVDESGSKSEPET